MYVKRNWNITFIYIDTGKCIGQVLNYRDSSYPTRLILAHMYLARTSIWKVRTAAFFFCTTITAVKITITSSTMTRSSAPPSDAPIVIAVLWDRVASGVDGAESCSVIGIAISYFEIVHTIFWSTESYKGVHNWRALFYNSTEIMIWLLGEPYKLLLWPCRMGVL